MPRPALLLLLAGAGLLAYALWRATESDVVQLVAVLLTGMALAGLYDAAMPIGTGMTRRDVGLVLLGMLAAFFLLYSVDLALRPLRSTATPAADAVRTALLVVWGLLPALAMVVRTSRPAPAPPLWPIGLAVVAALGLLLAGALLWGTVLRPFLTGTLGAGQFLSLPLTLGVIGLVGTLAAALWLRAGLGATPWSADLFGRAMGGALVGVAVGGGLLLVAALLGPTVRGHGAIASAILVLLVAGCWIAALAQVQATRAPTVLPVVVALIVTVPAMAISLALPLMVFNAREWAPFVLLFAAPLTLGAAGAVLWLWPRLIALLLGDGNAGTVPA